MQFVEIFDASITHCDKYDDDQFLRIISVLNHVEYDLHKNVKH